MRGRVAALLAVLCVLATPFELLLPDVHDEHAAAAQIVVGAGQHTHLTRLPSGTPDTPAPMPSHSGHVDHCAHAHLFALSFAQQAPESLIAETGVPDTSGPRLASISAPPRQRPPIA